MYLICLRGYTIALTAKDLYVSHSTVERIVDLYKTTGDIVSVQERHGPPRKLSEFEELTVLESFFKHPGIYLREVREELFRLTGTKVDSSTICRTAQRLSLTRQKMKKIAVKQSDVKRAEYMVEIEPFDPEMLVFIDETGFDKHNLVRQYGYGIRGLTPVTHKFVVYGRRISAIGVLTTEGVEDAYLVEGNVNGDTLQFIQRSLLNIIQPFNGSNPKSVVVLDNASIHHVDAVVDMITATGALVRFLPPYSPDLNPIEEVFSQVKSYIRDNEIIYQTTEEPRLIIASAFASIITQDCQNYIKHAGYIE